jgi:biopolymer transport protein ExbD
MDIVRSGNGPQQAAINVTPLIDVLLVLLIIFMVITPLAPMGLPALLPQPQVENQTEAVRPTEVVITVTKDGAVLLNHQLIEISVLMARMAQIYRVRGNDVVFVRGERGLEFRQVAAVIDAINGAGFTRVALMTT